jgi:hypothetical protein
MELRKFKLLKDTPDAKKDDIFVSDGIIFTKTGNNLCRYSYHIVENNPEWFEEIKEKERIKLCKHGSATSFVSSVCLLSKNNLVAKERWDSFSDEEVKLMEAALNGALFTKEEVQIIIQEIVSFYSEKDSSKISDLSKMIIHRVKKNRA